ncbi:MAG: NADH-quinone oxidoreductase subunit M [Bacteroidia bacterium]|nr:NADH-quinone oxidoreductase subunit M [Bacteroidia bacterium]
MLRPLTIIHGTLQLAIWGILYVHSPSEGLHYQRVWFNLGSTEFFYSIGAHPANFALILLTILIGHLALLYGQGQVSRVREFSALVLLTVGFCQGVFLAEDVLLFFVFYEAALIPSFLLIYGWGGEGRKSAAVKFALFTLGGSVLLLVGIVIGLGDRAQGLHSSWQGAGLPPLAWLLMTVGLSVKLPLFPLHSWLGEAHVEAETSISMILAGILLKLGGYALLYWVWKGIGEGQSLLLRVWGGVSLVYAGAVAAGQHDLKRLIAFTSVAHMAVVAIGAGAQSVDGLRGAYHQLFAHGVIIAGLFAWIGLVEKKLKGRLISELRGRFSQRKRWQLQAALLFFGAMGAPGMALFISELMVIWGVAKGVGWAWALLPGVGLLLTAIYFLRVYRELGGRREEERVLLEPMDLQEGIVWGLIGFSGVVGLYPAIWLNLLSHVGR